MQSEWIGEPAVIVHVVPEACQFHTFGCVNCLWQSCECKGGSMYVPTSDPETPCKSYVYYD